MHSILKRRRDSDFFRPTGDLRSKLFDQQIPLPTQASSSHRKKINVLLIPKLDILNEPTQNSRPQGSILNYFWEETQEIDLNKNIVKYNLLYKGLSHPESQNSKLDRDQFQKFRQNSCHFYSIQLAKNLSDNNFQYTHERSSNKEKRRNDDFEKNSISNKHSNRSRSSSFKKINRDTNIDVWHAEGLKFGSNTLKFGIRNKHIVMVINQQKHSKSGTNQRSKVRQQIQLIKSIQDKWIKFIREANKKCIIAIINLRTQGGEEGLQIQERVKQPNVYEVNMTALNINDTAKSKRLVSVVDELLEDYMNNNRGFSNADKSYSTFVKFPNKKEEEQIPISHHSTPIGTPRNKDFIKEQQTASYNIPKLKNVDSPDIPTNLKLQSGMMTNRRGKTKTPQKNADQTNKKTQIASTTHKRSLSPFFLSNETQAKKKKRKIEILSKTLKIQDFNENCDIFLPFCCLKKTVIQSTIMDSERPQKEEIRPRMREGNRITRDLFKNEV